MSKRTNESIDKYLEDNYYKDNQSLNIENFTDTKWAKKHKRFDAVECFYKDYGFLDIQTLDCVEPSRLGHIPYCIKVDWGWSITVQRFGQLTDADIDKALIYLLKEVLELGLIWNIRFEGRLIRNNLFNDYRFDSDFLRTCIVPSRKVKNGK